MRKTQNKGITLIALVITVIVLLILAGVSIAMLTGENGILTQAQNAKTETEKKEAKERIELEVLGSYGTSGEIDIATLKANIAKNIPGAVIGEETELPLTVTVGDYTFKVKENGIVEEVTSGEVITPPTEDDDDDTTVLDTSGANHPDLKTGMTAITFNADGTDSEVTDSTKRNWYNYAVQDGLTNEYNDETGEWGTSHWANAKINNNYYVWIPRYAYKIDTSVSYTSQSGTSKKIDVKFIGTDVTQENIETKLGASYADYIVHPAFTFGTKTVEGAEVANELSGIWVGKYETSGTATAPTILPNQVAATKTTISDLTVAKMFDMAKNVLTSDTQKAELDAHMMKNTEWGAVAYLAQSQYGRNGTEISVNQSSQKITGAGKTEGTNLIYESSSYSTAPTAEQKYSGKIGKLSSTTGNIYGVYDMSGGAYEYVMGFYGTAENTPTLGSTGFTADTQPERKYYDLYINKTSADNTNIGDALYETSGWNSDDANFVSSDVPVFLRGGNYYSTDDAGAFYFSNSNGSASSNISFRVCLAVK